MPLTGKVAVVNLTTGEITKKSIPEKIRRLYLGGRGLQAYLIYNHLKQGADPLGPDNVLVVSAGVLTGAMAPASARSQWGGKSPITGAIASSNMGGFVGSELKFAGFEHLVIKGAAKRPVYLWVNDGEIEIRDASGTWGRDTFETQQLIREELDDEKIKVACIGIAGENLVRLANFRTGPKDAAGRTGTGCIGGSKKLKAIAVRGRLGLRPAHPKEALDYAKWAIDKIMMTKVAKAMGVDGTSYIWNVTNSSGLLEWMNGQTNKFPFGDWHDMTIEKFHEGYATGIAACHNCTVHCRHQFRLKEGPRAGDFGEGPEYNTQTAFGTFGLNNWGDMLLAWQLANLYGIDTTEWCNAVRGVMELFQRGIINKRVTGGLDLSWSNASEITPKLLELTAQNKGIGAVLGLGAKGIIEKLGKYSDKVSYYIQNCKGLGKLGNVDRIQPSFSLGMATSTRGADHLRSRPAIDHYHLPEKVLSDLYGGKVSSDYTSYEGKARMVRWQEHTFAIVDSLGLCKFQTVFFSPNLPCYEEWCKYLLYNTGLEFTPDELFEIGERIYTLEKMINHREAGHTRKDDYPPERSFKEAHTQGLGPVKGRHLDKKKYEKMLDEYYRLHGWSLNGIPKRATLKRLQLAQEPSHII